MEGDKVSITACVEERNGVLEYHEEVPNKPEFMLNEEYNQHLIECAVNMVRTVCMYIYPDNKEGRKNIAKLIEKRVNGI